MQTIWNDSNQSIPSMGLSVVYQSTAALDPFARNARTHSKRPIRQIADSITTFGFTNPILIDSRDTIIAGHGPLCAAQLLGIDQVPTIRLENLTGPNQSLRHSGQPAGREGRLQ
jgi:ParB-like chromosome segregation protein Spo0J